MADVLPPASVLLAALDHVVVVVLGPAIVLDEEWRELELEPLQRVVGLAGFLEELAVGRVVAENAIAEIGVDNALRNQMNGGLRRNYLEVGKEDGIGGALGGREVDLERLEERVDAVLGVVVRHTALAKGVDEEHVGQGHGGRLEEGGVVEMMEGEELRRGRNRRGRRRLTSEIMR